MGRPEARQPQELHSFLSDVPATRLPQRPWSRQFGKYVHFHQIRSATCVHHACAPQCHTTRAVLGQLQKNQNEGFTTNRRVSDVTGADTSPQSRRYRSCCRCKYSPCPQEVLYDEATSGTHEGCSRSHLRPLAPPGYPVL